MSSEEEAIEGLVTVESDFLPARNVLALRGKFSPLYVDYYLHLMQHGLRPEPAHDAMLKEALAALVLHLASRPRDETVAWTIHLQNPTLNLFVTGNNYLGSVTGRVFTEHVRESDHNLFFAQVVRGTSDPRQSVIAVVGDSMMGFAEQFYVQSQQQSVRYFQMEDPEDFLFLAAQPACDTAWLEAFRSEDPRGQLENEEVKRIDTRTYHFGCECTLQRIVKAVASLGPSSGDELFEGDETIQISCPRCGAIYETTREQMRKFWQTDA